MLNTIEIKLCRQNVLRANSNSQFLWKKLNVWMNMHGIANNILIGSIYSGIETSLL